MVEYEFNHLKKKLKTHNYCFHFGIIYFKWIILTQNSRMRGPMALRLCPCACCLCQPRCHFLFYYYYFSIFWILCTRKWLDKTRQLSRCLGLRLVLWWVVQSGSDDARAFLIIIFESNEHGARFAMALLNQGFAINWLINYKLNKNFRIFCL